MTIYVKAPKLISGTPSVGDWVNAQISLPEVVVGLAETIGSVTSLITSVMELGVSALEIAKTFSVGYIDPAIAIINAVIQEFERIVADLEQLGLYYTGDWNLFQSPFKDLKGGFQAFQRRMVARLTDTNDPNRPDVKHATTLALFMYAEVDFFGEVRRIWTAIQRLMKFFKQNYAGKPPRFLPTPTNIKVTYGIEGLTHINDFKELATAFDTDPRTPTIASIQWKASFPEANPAAGFAPSSPPGGFLVEVSTTPQGLQIGFEREISQAPLVNGNNGKKTALKEHGQVLTPDGKPFLLYGGIDQIKIDGSLQYNENVDSNGNLRRGGTRVYGTRGPTEKVPIPLDLLKQGNKYLLQRTFFVDTQKLAQLFFFSGDQYHILIKREDLPYDAEFKKGTDGKITVTPSDQPSVFYVRIAAVSDRIQGTDHFQYVLEKPAAQRPGFPVQCTLGFSQVKTKSEPAGTPLSEQDKGPLSKPLSVVFPSQQTQDLLDSIQTALAVVYLSRSDLRSYSLEYLQASIPFLKGTLDLTEAQQIYEGKASQVPVNFARDTTGLEGTVAKYVERLLFPGTSGEGAIQTVQIGTKNLSPVEFQTVLERACRVAAQNIYKRLNLSPNQEKELVSSSLALRTWKWKDSKNAGTWPKKLIIEADFMEKTILDTLRLRDDSDDGLALNVWNLGVPPAIISPHIQKAENGMIHARMPGYLETKALGSDPDIKSTMTQEEVQELLAKKPQYGVFLSRFRKVTGNKVSYEIPASIRTLKSPEQALRYGSADESPVLFSGTLEELSSGYGHILFCRNAFDATIYTGTQQLLNTVLATSTRPPQDTEWVAMRFFTGFPDVGDFIKIVNDWLKGLKSGAQSISNAIQSMIDFLKARIKDLQALIAKIESLLYWATAFSFELPSVLVLASQGTGGILRDFTNAGQKPSSSPEAYGAGAAVLFPAFPPAVLPLILSFFQPPNN